MFGTFTFQVTIRIGIRISICHIICSIRIIANVRVAIGGAMVGRRVVLLLL